jgi:7-carboxy-7-deazaguanine synthase
MAKTQDNVVHVVEIFRSLQGETSFAGLPFAFVRLAGCELECRWCDTAYARHARGKPMTIPQVLDAVEELGPRRVCITGGEPLLQRESPQLAFRLSQRGFRVLVETSGAYDISTLPHPIIRIMDIKCPSSGMSEKMDWYNLGHLRRDDQVKFIIADREDYEWARGHIEKFSLSEKCTVLMGAVSGELEPGLLGDWILFDDLEARLQVQLHKIIWPDREREA